MDNKRATKRFQRVRENFICGICKSRVSGNGFTDHCPNCLFSRHVDIKPGDRSSECRGMMKPYSATYSRDCFTIYYRCERCGARHRVKAAGNDNRDLMISMLDAQSAGTT